MKRTFAAIALGIALVSPIQAGPLDGHKPDYYEFDYKYKNWRIIEDTVCDRYSGSDWKECRRYANWVFAERCWEYRNKLRHTSGDVRREYMNKRNMYCHAKRWINTL